MLALLYLSTTTILSTVRPAGYSHIVIKTTLNSGTNITTIAAGNGTAGSTPTMLNTPVGIFADAHLNLYVSDCYNHRIQFFPFGQLNATTVAGNGTANTINLSFPHAVTLDIKGIFIHCG